MKIITLILPTLVGFQLMHTANGDAQYFGGGLPRLVYAGEENDNITSVYVHNL